MNQRETTISFSFTFEALFHFFPRSLVPSALSSLERICWFGIAFPDSYSWITCGFSLISYNNQNISYYQQVSSYFQQETIERKRVKSEEKVLERVGSESASSPLGLAWWLSSARLAHVHLISNTIHINKVLKITNIPFNLTHKWKTQWFMDKQLQLLASQ